MDVEFLRLHWESKIADWIGTIQNPMVQVIALAPHLTFGGCVTVGVRTLSFPRTA
jgi:hypothetical protein